jgi:hypothetical protein
VNTAGRKRRYECIGGPMCGKRIEGGGDRVACEDEAGVHHYYRLIRVAKNDFSAFAKFYHYFGTNISAAEAAMPCLIPPQRLFRKKKKR